MNNIFSSFSPFINKTSNLRSENTEFKMKILHFEPLNINTQPIKQIRIKLERKLSPIQDQNYNALFLNKIKVQKMALKKAKLSSSIDYRALPELDFNAQLQFVQPTTLIMPTTQRNNKNHISQQRRQKFKDSSLFQSQNKAQSKCGFRLPKIDKSIDINESRSSLNCWTMNSSSSLLQANK